MTAKYEFRNEYTKALKILRVSYTYKKKNNWSENGSAGFIQQDIQDINLIYKVRDSLHKNVIVIKTEAWTQEFYPDELNLRETREAVKWLENRNIKLGEL